MQRKDTNINLVVQNCFMRLSVWWRFYRSDFSLHSQMQSLLSKAENSRCLLEEYEIIGEIRKVGFNALYLKSLSKTSTKMYRRIKLFITVHFRYSAFRVFPCIKWSNLCVILQCFTVIFFSADVLQKKSVYVWIKFTVK